MSASEDKRLDAEAWLLLGSRRYDSGDRTGAEACFREALQCDPDNTEACANLALSLEQRSDANEAERYYRRALSLNPHLAACASNFGNFLTAQKRFDEANKMHRQALVNAPHSPSVWTNYGVLHACMQRFEEAEACHRRAIALAPDDATAHFNLSYLLLQQGRFDEGWQHFEYRKWYESLGKQMRCPRWQGESLVGKSLLIGAEAGYGDMIQFCRYVSLLKAQGVERIDLICHPPLKTLLQSLKGIDDLISYNHPLPKKDWDYWTPLMSLPYFHQTQLETIPASLPYLHAAPDRIARWEEMLPKKNLQGSLRIGISWKGNPRYENDADRSLPCLTLLQPLFEIKGVQWVSLQVSSQGSVQKSRDEAEAEAASKMWTLMNAASQIEDFSDTAAIIEQLDLVISVDTSVAHLAGALSKPCWVLLPDYKTDWRWLTERKDSPWYPNVIRLFRQTAQRSWEETIGEVKTALLELTGNP